MSKSTKKKSSASKTVKKVQTKSPKPATTSAAKTAKGKSAKPAPATKPQKPHGLQPGDAAPAFSLPRDGGGTVSLADFAGRKLVVFFYPRADTPGCTLEAVAFTRLAADFEACGTAILGVSADPVSAQDKFRDKHKLGVPLASDEAQSMLKAYHAWGEKSMYGKVFEGVLRTTYLIDAKGRIAQVWTSVKADGHAEIVLSAAQKL
jgi:peroxiredoxin Q/BCP